MGVWKPNFFRILCILLFVVVIQVLCEVDIKHYAKDSDHKEAKSSSQEKVRFCTSECVNLGGSSPVVKRGWVFLMVRRL